MPDHSAICAAIILQQLEGEMRLHNPHKNLDNVEKIWHTQSHKQNNVLTCHFFGESRQQRRDKWDIRHFLEFGLIKRHNIVDVFDLQSTKHIHIYMDNHTCVSRVTLSAFARVCHTFRSARIREILENIGPGRCCNILITPMVSAISP